MLQLLTLASCGERRYEAVAHSLVRSAGIVLPSSYHLLTDSNDLRKTRQCRYYLSEVLEVRNWSLQSYSLKDSPSIPLKI